MGFKKKINKYRRRLMNRLTKRIGQASLKNIDVSKKHDIKRVLVCRPNHRLGNLLLTTPLIQEINILFPNAKIDVVVQGGLAPILFQEYKNVDKIISLPKRAFKFPLQYAKGVLSIKKNRYDIAINAVKGSSSGRLFTLFSNSKYKIFGEEDDQFFSEKYSDYNHIAKQQVYGLREYVYKLGYPQITRPVAALDLKLSETELLAGKKNVDNLVDNDKETICIFTFATGAKCFLECWWGAFYERLKKEYPNYNIIEILPKENVSQIQFKAPSFYSRDIREIAAVIANTKVFIGADSGIMHLSCASGAPTVGLFSVTKVGKYKPYCNGVPLDTRITDLDASMILINNMLQKNK
ncbi:glycosyltransferase family 9 protein [Lacinutrix undariae]